MKRFRESWSWPAAVAPLVFGVALTLVVTSCGRAENPVAPGATGNLSAAQDAEPTPTPTPDGTPDPTPTPTPDPTPTPTPEPTPTPTPPQAGEGCTPGYWKQPHHFDSWPAPYTPDTPFDAVFEDAFGDMTLVQVLSLGGGGLNALGRAAVAALLNGASDGVDYDYTAQEVIDAFNAVYPGGDYETLKNELDFLNNQGCGLN